MYALIDTVIAYAAFMAGFWILAWINNKFETHERERPPDRPPPAPNIRVASQGTGPEPSRSRSPEGSAPDCPSEEEPAPQEDPGSDDAASPVATAYDFWAEVGPELHVTWGVIPTAAQMASREWCFTNARFWGVEGTIPLYTRAPRADKGKNVERAEGQSDVRALRTEHRHPPAPTVSPASVSGDSGDEEHALLAFTASRSVTPVVVVVSTPMCSPVRSAAIEVGVPQVVVAMTSPGGGVGSPSAVVAAPLMVSGPEAVSPAVVQTQAAHPRWYPVMLPTFSVSPAVKLSVSSFAAPVVPVRASAASSVAIDAVRAGSPSAMEVDAPGDVPMSGSGDSVPEDQDAEMNDSESSFVEARMEDAPRDIEAQAVDVSSDACHLPITGAPRKSSRPAMTSAPGGKSGKHSAKENPPARVRHWRNFGISGLFASSVAATRPVRTSSKRPPPPAEDSVMSDAARLSSLQGVVFNGSPIAAKGLKSGWSLKRTIVTAAPPPAKVPKPKRFTLAGLVAVTGMPILTGGNARSAKVVQAPTPSIGAEVSGAQATTQSPPSLDPAVQPSHLPLPAPGTPPLASTADPVPGLASMVGSQSPGPTVVVPDSAAPPPVTPASGKRGAGRFDRGRTFPVGIPRAPRHGAYVPLPEQMFSDESSDDEVDMSRVIAPMRAGASKAVPGPSFSAGSPVSSPSVRRKGLGAPSNLRLRNADGSPAAARNCPENQGDGQLLELRKAKARVSWQTRERPKGREDTESEG